MPQIDVTVPEKALDENRKAELLNRLTQILFKWEGVPENSPNRPFAWAYIHEVKIGEWAYGGKVATATDAPRYRVAVTVPEGVLNADRKKGLVEEVTQAIAETEDTEDKANVYPRVTCYILEVNEGGYGVAGTIFHLPKAVTT